jgi:hypothetical protein
VLRVKSFEHSVAKLALEKRARSQNRARRRVAGVGRLKIFFLTGAAPIPELEGTEAEKLYDINKLEQVHR